MSLARRRFLHLAAAGVALPAAWRAARAQSYPSHPIRLIVGFAAGGAPDILARIVGEWLSDRLGQPIVVENRPGAGSNIATEAVLNSAPDGYTLLLASLGNAVNTTLYGKLSYNFIHDAAPVAIVSREPLAMEINPSFPARTVPEFIAYAKANPGKLAMASPGIGTSPHMAGELFKFMAGLDMVHVPYRASPPALADLLSGEVQMMFSPLPPSIEFVRTGKLRALAVTTAARSGVLPDVPTVGDFLPGYEASAFYGIAAPARTPAAIVDRLNMEINAGLADPRLKARLADLGSVVTVGSPSDFGKLIAEETEKWAKVVRAANIKVQ